MENVRIDEQSQMDAWIGMWDDMQEEIKTKSCEHSAPKQESIKYTEEDYDVENLCDDLLFEDHNVANPVYPDSVGPDSDLHPAWAKEDFGKEVEDLKVKIFNLENKIASKMGGDKEWTEKAYEPNIKKMAEEVKSLKDKLEKLSSVLGIEDEPSPCKIKS